LKELDKYSTNDVVGCGINFFKREIFFTKNGIYHGTHLYLYKKGSAFVQVEIKEFFPTLGLGSP
jgi:hypothetical protein